MVILKHLTHKKEEQMLSRLIFKAKICMFITLHHSRSQNWL